MWLAYDCNQLCFVSEYFCREHGDVARVAISSFTVCSISYPGTTGIPDIFEKYNGHRMAKINSYITGVVCKHFHGDGNFFSFLFQTINK